MSDALSLDFGTLSSPNYELGEVAETRADGLVFLKAPSLMIFSLIP
jgi:hypothetical protein